MCAARLRVTRGATISFALTSGTFPEFTMTPVDVFFNGNTDVAESNSVVRLNASLALDIVNEFAKDRSPRRIELLESVQFAIFDGSYR